jgi:hypothetical protein
MWCLDRTQGGQQRLSDEGDVEAAEQADPGERALNRVVPGDADQVAANSMPVYATPLTRACRTHLGGRHSGARPSGQRSTAVRPDRLIVGRSSRAAISNGYSKQWLLE